MRLPDGKVVDILDSVMEEICCWLQDDSLKPESGGYIVGYQHKDTGNISLEAVSHPYKFDVRRRTRFAIRDLRHRKFLAKAKGAMSYYMGVWHTHPQRIPVPSTIDWDDWNQTLELDKPGGEYIFFIIAGTEEIRIWAGDVRTRIISEIFECRRGTDGIYI